MKKYNEYVITIKENVVLEHKIYEIVASSREEALEFAEAIMKSGEYDWTATPIDDDREIIYEQYDIDAEDFEFAMRDYEELKNFIAPFLNENEETNEVLGCV